VIAVTGADGFIGSHLVRRLREEGLPVKQFCGPPAAEITDDRALDALLDGVHFVAHLAGLPSVADSWARPQEHMRVHVAGTAALLEACRRRGVQRVVYTSSAEVYGRAEAEFVNEQQPLAPCSPYAAAKIGAEKLLEVYSRAFGLETVILRPFSVFGPGASRQSVLFRIFTQVKAGDDVELEDLTPVRDFTFVEDVTDAIARALTQAGESTILNIGSMRPTSIGELAAIVSRLAGGSGQVRTSGPQTRPGRCHTPRLVADNRRARQVLGWEPRIALEEGLLRTLRS
jgi:nucleoside-diphosphate-sugar epimerase